MIIHIAAVVFLALPVSWWLTGQVRRYALARSVLDVPNIRSSHSAPTPRGGGLAIVAVVLPGLVLLRVLNVLTTDTTAALVGGGALVSSVGWLDDHRNTPAAMRAAVHFVAAGWAVAWLGGFDNIDIGATDLHLDVTGTVLAVIGIVWCTNLYNFMDGIDGIAGGEAVSVGIFGGTLLVIAGNAGLASIAFLVAAAGGGFLVWNWPPAKIFMGDVGSGFLGYVFGVLALWSETAGAVPVILWMLLLGMFWFDATTTLVRRVVRGERWYDAHHSHMYQRAVQSGLSHAQVTGVVLCVNVILGTLAIAGLIRSWAPATLVIGILILSLLYGAVERLRPMQSLEG